MSITNEVIDALHQRIKTLAENSTPNQLAYLAKSLESITDKKAISNIVQMTTIKEIVDALHKRLKDLAVNSTPDQLAYLAKALESIVDKSAISDIVQMTDEKLKELLDKAKAHLNDLDANKTNALAAISESEKQSLKRIDEKGVSGISLLDTRKNVNVAAINSIGKDQMDSLKSLVSDFRTVNDVPSGSSIMKEVRNRNMVEPGSLPFLFGVLSRKNNYFGHGTFTTELGEWSSDITKTDYMLQLLTGSHTYDTSYVSFYRPRQLCFIEGSKGTFIYGELYANLINESSSKSMYQYPYAALGVIFVKNTTNEDINTTVNFVGSAEGAGLFVGTPDNINTNKSQISRVTWINIYKHTSSDKEFSASGSIVIPARKTVAILFYTSSKLLDSGEVKVAGRITYKNPRAYERDDLPHFMYTNYDFYNQFIQWGIYNFRSNFLTTGLEVDVERTLKAWQCPGLQHTYQIWQ